MTRVRGTKAPAVDSGTYALWIALDRGASLVAGALGRVEVPRGVHLYVGSARRAMAARVARHLTRVHGPPQTIRARSLQQLGAAAPAAKRAHWHVDHLLQLRFARVYRVSLLHGVFCECELVLALRAEAGARVTVPGFGSSDCRRRCGAHLLLLPHGRRRLARRVLAAAGVAREVV